MTFFDKKEEVMKIELTPYGRYLLSIGKLKPHSYRFFDENIIYDSNCGGFVEAQNDAHTRITSETPILKGNPNLTGVETNIKKFDSEDVFVQNVRQPTSDDIISTNNESIGTNDYNSEYSPYFKVELFRGEMLKDKITMTYTGSVVGSPIPQLPINIHVSASYISEDQPILFSDNNTIVQESNKFEDGNRIRIQYQEPIVRIHEINSFDQTGNFNVSAYKVFSSSAGIVYNRLTFPKQTKKIVNGILLDNLPASESALFDGFPEAMIGTDDYIGGEFEDPNRIDYFLDMFVDREISENEICNAIGELKIKNIFLDEEIQCPDEETANNFNIYSSRISPDDLEDCE